MEYSDVCHNDLNEDHLCMNWRGSCAMAPSLYLHKAMQWFQWNLCHNATNHSRTIPIITNIFNLWIRTCTSLIILWCCNTPLFCIQLPSNSITPYVEQAVRKICVQFSLEHKPCTSFPHDTINSWNHNMMFSCVSLYVSRNVLPVFVNWSSYT